MKSYFLSVVALVLLASACNPVPNSSVFEPLETKVLAGIVKRDTQFLNFYEEIQKGTAKFNEIEKVKFNDITYRKLYAVTEFSRDTVEMAPRMKAWTEEWEQQFGMYAAQADSVIDYWVRYKEANSLDRFVEIQFAALDKEYYTYSRDVKNVNFAFRLTPKEGAIEQMRFNYRYTAKINDIRYAEKHSCIMTSPFSGPVTKYCEVGYSDEKRLKYVTSSEFKRDYDISFEVTEVRKDGVNYSIDDLNIPQAVQKVLETDSTQYPYLYELRKDDVIRESLCPEYRELYKFCSERFNQLLQKKFPKEAAFLDYMDSK